MGFVSPFIHSPLGFNIKMNTLDGATVDQLLQLELDKAKIQAEKEIEFKKIQVQADKEKEIEFKKVQADKEKEFKKIQADKEIRLRKIDKEAELDNPRELPCPQLALCPIIFVDSKLAYSAQ